MMKKAFVFGVVLGLIASKAWGADLHVPSQYSSGGNTYLQNAKNKDLTLSSLPSSQMEKIKMPEDEAIEKKIATGETLLIAFPKRPTFDPPVDWHHPEMNLIYYESYFENYIKTIVDWLNKSSINKNYLAQFVIQESKKSTENFIEEWQVFKQNLDKDNEKEIAIVISVNSANLEEADPEFEIPWSKPFIIDIKDNKYILTSFPKKPRFNPPTEPKATEPWSHHERYFREWEECKESYFDNYAKIIVSWLNEHSINKNYLSLFLSQKEEREPDTPYFPEEWQLFEEDLDNDNKKEIIIAISRIIGFGAATSRLFIVDSKDDEYFLSVELQKGETTRIEIERIADINRDNWKEIILFGYWCGASTCGIDISLIRYDYKEKAYKYLNKEEIISVNAVDSDEAKSKAIRFEDCDNDGVLEIITWGGYRVRTGTNIYKWNGEFYVHSETIWDPPEYLIHAIYDANEALLKKDYQKAITLYKKIIYEQPYKTIGDLTGEKEEGEKEKQHLTAFARFRLILAYLLQKDENQAKTILEKIKKEQPEHICTTLSQILWENYQTIKDITKACKEVINYAKGNPKIKEDFYEYFIGQHYGYYDLPYDWEMEDICPLLNFSK
jgi:hypothetical protein